jgi:hypothetical protein
LDVLTGRDRAAAAPTFAACGLYLVRVEYDQAFDLPNGPEAGIPCALWGKPESRSAG